MSLESTKKKIQFTPCLLNFFFEFFEFLNRHTNTHMAIAVQEILKFMEL